MSFLLKNIWSRLGLGSLLALLLVGDSAFAFQGTVERTFEVSPGGQLVVDAERASIKVVSRSGNRLRLEIVPKGSLRDIEDEYRVHFDQSGNRVVLKLESRGGSTFRWLSWNRKSVEIRAWVPTEFNVDLKTSGGSISVDDLRGDVRSATSGGSLKFGRIEGTVWGRTSGGSISLTESEGDANVKTSGGSIHIGDVDGNVDAKTSGGSISVARARGDIQVYTSGGSIKIEEALGSIDAKTSGGSVTASISEQPEGRCRLTTSGGNVNVYLASGLRFDIDAKASGGRVRSDLDIDGRVRKTSVRGRLNDGGPELFLRTSGGSIRINQIKGSR